MWRFGLFFHNVICIVFRNNSSVTRRIAHIKASRICPVEIHNPVRRNRCIELYWTKDERFNPQNITPLLILLLLLFGTYNKWKQWRGLKYIRNKGASSFDGGGGGCCWPSLDSSWGCRCCCYGSGSIVDRTIAIVLRCMLFGLCCTQAPTCQPPSLYPFNPLFATSGRTKTSRFCRHQQGLCSCYFGHISRTERSGGHAERLA